MYTEFYRRVIYTDKTLRQICSMFLLVMSDDVFALYRNSLNKDNKMFLKCI